MICSKCGSDHVNIQMIQKSLKTNTKNMGCLFGIIRFMLICCTGGLWLLLGKKKSTSKTKIKNEKIAICQNCANQWKI